MHCQPDNAAAEGEDAAHGASTTLANMFPTTTIPDAHLHSGLAGTAGTGMEPSYTGQTINFTFTWH